MMSRSALLLAATALLAVAWAVTARADSGEGVYYVCGCESACSCDTIAKRPGDCSCGNRLVAMRLMTVERDTAVFCRCDAGCACAVSRSDPDQCECGTKVKRIGVKGRYKSSGCLCSGLEYTLDL